jgi:hypothetical protein
MEVLRAILGAETVEKMTPGEIAARARAGRGNSQGSGAREQSLRVVVEAAARLGKEPDRAPLHNQRPPGFL